MKDARIPAISVRCNRTTALSAVGVTLMLALSVFGVPAGHAAVIGDGDAVDETQPAQHSLSLEAIERALTESKDALEDVEANLQHTPRRIDRASLKAARNKLIGTIKALEWQRTNMLENKSRLHAMDADAEEKRVSAQAKRIAIEQQIAAEIIVQKQELARMRREVLHELQQTREELAAEIAQLQTTINAYRSDQHKERMRALRKAELAVSEMEQQHLSAIEATEAEIQKVQKELDAKLKKQSALEEKFKLYSRE